MQKFAKALCTQYLIFAAAFNVKKRNVTGVNFIDKKLLLYSQARLAASVSF
jgi:hypothetical protein